MPVHNEGIASVFDVTAGLLEIEGDNPFRIRAYRNGVRILCELRRDIRLLMERGEAISRLSGSVRVKGCNPHCPGRPLWQSKQATDCF